MKVAVMFSAWLRKEQFVDLNELDFFLHISIHYQFLLNNNAVWLTVTNIVL